MILRHKQELEGKDDEEIDRATKEIVAQANKVNSKAAQ
jgi:hypothetical protein